ncbi:MAG TPA: class I SAM-dependent methyltransferase [Polyangiaceae bacterium]|nr:class I SAM-dependent methyltransferase [Polyangiaceae bacterium]
MVDERSPDGDAAQAHWDFHYSRCAGDYAKHAVGTGAQEVDILEAVSGLDLGTALDVGCGAGGLCIELARRGWVVTGIDIAGRAIDIARRLAAEQGVNATFLRADATAWQPDQSYDLVICNFGLPPDPEARAAVYGTMRSAVAPGGVVLLKIGDNEGATDATAHTGYDTLDLRELQGGFEGFEAMRSERRQSPAHSHFGPKAHRKNWRTLLFVARKPAR